MNYKWAVIKKNLIKSQTNHISSHNLYLNMQCADITTNKRVFLLVSFYLIVQNKKENVPANTNPDVILPIQKKN